MEDTEYEESVDHTPPDQVTIPEDLGQEDQVEKNEKDQEDESEDLRREQAKARREARTRRKLQKEVADVRQQMDELRQGLSVGHTQGNLQSAQSDYAHAESLYQQALSTGDPGKITLANRQLMQKYSNLVLTAQQTEAYQRQMQQQQQQQQQQRPLQPEPATVRSWRSKHDWFDDPDHEEETEMAQKIDYRLAQEWDADDIASPEYFQELDKRLSKKLPHLYHTKQPSGGQNVAGSGRATQSTKPQLPRELIEAGRLMGRPVDDPKWRQTMLNKYVRKA